NLTSDGVNVYAFDAENKVVSVINGSGTATITRDAFDRIVEVDQPSGVTREIVYSAVGKRAIMAGPFTVEYDFAALPGGGELEAIDGGSGGYLFHHKDWLGTSRLVSNLETQVMYFDTAYAPYGENYAPSGTTDLDFTGQTQNVVTGIYDFPFREFNPNHGRWLSPDCASPKFYPSKKSTGWESIHKLQSAMQMTHASPLARTRCAFLSLPS
ncbi:MAG: RHS repeat-associated core domain-containing protein, partial [Candidatus Sulfotelmatobacter sp.]